MSRCPLSISPSIPCMTRPANAEGQEQARGMSLLARRSAHCLARGTTAWPLTPKPPSGVSSISTNSLRWESGENSMAVLTTSVTLLIRAAFCSTESTPAGKLISTKGAPKPLFSQRPAVHRDLHSFPTPRSADLILLEIAVLALDED